jgi:hypothetical protein
MTDVAVPPTPSPESKGPVWLALRVFDEPGAVFAELARRPRALLPILLFVSVTLGVAMLVPTPVLRSAAEQQFRALEQRSPGAIPPEIRARALGDAGTAKNRAAVFIAATAGGLLMVAIASGVLLLIFNAVGGGDMRYRDEWSIAWHAYLPQVVGIVITWLGITFTNDMQFRPGLGFLVSADTSRFGHSLAQQFTIFGAWNVYLLALGNQIRTRARGIGPSLTIVGILWVCVNLLFAFLGQLGLAV